MDKLIWSLTGASIPWGNEADIFIIAILGEISFCHFRGRDFSHFRGKEILVHERFGDVFRGEY